MDLNCINGIYQLQQKIGSRAFSTQLVTSTVILTYNWIGEVFLACNILMVQDIVIKLEPLSQHLLEHEYQVYKKLSRLIGILCDHWFGAEGGFNVMALDCLGQSLEDLFTCCHFKFTVQTILVLAKQLVGMSSL
jgi:hypothetical protein